MLLWSKILTVWHKDQPDLLCYKVDWEHLTTATCNCEADVLYLIDNDTFPLSSPTNASSDSAYKLKLYMNKCVWISLCIWCFYINEYVYVRVYE